MTASTDKPQTKMEWMLQELHKDGFYPSEKAINSVIAGDEPEFFEPELIDYIQALESEWVE